MKFPNIFSFQDYESYLQEFVLLNQSESNPGSFRYFARRLGWPHSYLHEIVNGRKRLSVARAIEFGIFAKLNSFEAERLVYFAMLDKTEASDSPVQLFFNQKLRVEQTPDLPEDSVVIDDELIEPKDFDALAFAVFEALIWAEGKISPDEIVKLLYTFDRLSEEEVLTAVEFLESKKIIRRLADNHYDIPVKMIFIHEAEGATSAPEQHQKMAENFIRFLSNPIRPYTFNTGFVQFPKAMVPQIHEKIHMLRNWFENLNTETLANDVLLPSEKLVFQYDLHLFPILEPSLAAEFKVSKKDSST